MSTITPTSGYREFGCIAYEGVSVGPDLPASIEMGDNQHVVFVPPVQLDKFWQDDLGNYQYQHLAKSNFAIELVQPEGETSALIDLTNQTALSCWNGEAVLILPQSRR